VRVWSYAEYVAAARRRPASVSNREEKLSPGDERGKKLKRGMEGREEVGCTGGRGESHEEMTHTGKDGEKQHN